MRPRGLWPAALANAVQRRPRLCRPALPGGRLSRPHTCVSGLSTCQAGLSPVDLRKGAKPVTGIREPLAPSRASPPRVSRAKLEPRAPAARAVGTWPLRVVLSAWGQHRDMTHVRSDLHLFLRATWRLSSLVGTLLLFLLPNKKKEINRTLVLNAIETQI